MIAHKPDIKEDDRMSISQICSTLGICRNTVYAKIAEYGIVKHVPRCGGRAYYLGKDVLKIWLRF